MAESIENIDLAVIGSGATGMVAALTAAEGGAKVIIFEKMRNLGGVSNFAEGMFAGRLRADVSPVYWLEEKKTE